MDNMGLKNIAKKVIEFLADELPLNGLDMIKNSNIMFNNLWDHDFHINYGAVRKFSGVLCESVPYAEVYIPETQCVS